MACEASGNVVNRNVYLTAQVCLTAQKVISPAVGGYLIAGDVNLALQSCLSRRNLAVRLVEKLYTLCGRVDSNCHGVQHPERLAEY